MSRTAARTVAASSLVVALLACLHACASTRRAAPAPAPEPVADVREATLQNGFISVRIASPPAPAGRRAAIISLLGEENTLVEAGFVVVSYSIRWDRFKVGGSPPPPPPPPPARGRVGSWLLASPTPKTVGKGYFEIIAANSRGAIPLVLDHLLTLPDVDPARIGIAGVSTNGFIALEAAADPRISAAAAIAACGDYHTFLERSNLAMNGAPLDLDPAYDAQLRRQEPVRHARALVHAALLMVNGSEDATVPAPCALRTAHVLGRAYARARMRDRLRFVLVPGSGHNDLANQAREEMRAWFGRWLSNVP